MSSIFNFCQNCLKNIPSSKFDLHEAYCSRYNVYCFKCKQSYDSKQQSNHDQIHQKIQCKICKKMFQRVYLDDHISSCKLEQIDCIYCQLRILQEDENHLERCGNRTQKCQICNDYVRKKDFIVHKQVCLFKLKQKRELNRKSQLLKLKQKQIRNPIKQEFQLQPNTDTINFFEKRNQSIKQEAKFYQYQQSIDISELDEQVQKIYMMSIMQNLSRKN